MNPPAGWFPVEHTAAFAVHGPDALRYLNGQLSIDIKRLPAGIARQACLLTAKGKLCALTLVWRQDGTFILECPADLADQFHARLERYLIADNATIEPVTLPPRFHLLGTTTAPADSIAANRLGTPGHDTTTAPDSPPLHPATIEAIRILHLMPAWDIDITTDTLPQEANLDLAAVDFDKGCYVGQETVSRLRSVGRANKRLHLLTGRIDPSASNPLTLHPQESPATAAGHITSHTTLPDDPAHFPIAQSAALGYLHRMHEDNRTFQVRDADGRECGTLQRQPHPQP